MDADAVEWVRRTAHTEATRAAPSTSQVATSPLAEPDMMPERIRQALVRVLRAQRQDPPFEQEPL